MPSERPVEDTALGVIALPKFETLKNRKAERSEASGRVDRIPRDNAALFQRAIEIDPNADTNFDIFEDKIEVDFVSILLGQGADTFFGIESAYLQLGHAALLLVILLAALVDEPSFPLTNLPIEYRDFLKQGLAVTTVSLRICVVASVHRIAGGQHRGCVTCSCRVVQTQTARRVLGWEVLSPRRRCPQSVAHGDRSGVKIVSDVLEMPYIPQDTSSISVEVHFC